MKLIIVMCIIAMCKKRKFRRIRINSFKVISNFNSCKIIENSNEELKRTSFRNSIL